MDPTELQLLAYEDECNRIGATYCDRWLNERETCPVCGQVTRNRDPYPGVVMRMYVLALTSGTYGIPYFKCCDCEVDLEAMGRRFAALIES